MRGRPHGRHIRPHKAEVRGFLVDREGMHRGRDGRNRGRQKGHPGVPDRAERGILVVGRLPGTPEGEGHRRPEAVHHRWAPRDAGGDSRLVPRRQAAKVPRPHTAQHLKGREGQGPEGDRRGLQIRLREGRRGRNVLRLRCVLVEMGQALPEAHVLAHRHKGGSVRLSAFPQVHAVGDHDVKRHRVVQLMPKKADQAPGDNQFRDQRPHRHVPGHKRLRAELEGGEIPEIHGRGGKTETRIQIDDRRGRRLLCPIHKLSCKSQQLKLKKRF